MTRLVLNRDGGKTDEFGHLLALGRLFSGEVINGLTVSQNGTPNMTVNAAAGSAQVPTGSGATAYKYYVASDATENVTITTADGSNPRLDYIVAYVDKSVTASTAVTNNSNNMFKIVAVAGTPATVPADPSVSQIQTAIGASNPYIIIARVHVATATTTITDANIDSLVTPAQLSAATSANDGWIVGDSLTYGTNNGAKEYTVTIVGDKTTRYWPGMKVKVTRGTAPPTQCTDLESGSSQYASKASPTNVTFTDDFTVEAWIKVESYSTGTILSRRDATPTQGWGFRITNAGQVEIYGGTGSAFDLATTRQSVPLGTWVHVAGTLNMSASTANVYVNGIDAPLSYTNSGATALTQSGDMAIGEAGSSAAEYFDGKIADVRLWGVVRTQTQIRTSMNQQLVGNETNLVGYWKLNGNFNDSQSNFTANNLTAGGSASALNADNPMNSTEYAIITAINYSSPNTTLTLFAGTDCNIPNMTLSSMYYSTQRAPYGFPVSRVKWKSELLFVGDSGFMAVGGFNTWINGNGYKLNIPTGDWALSFQLYAEQNNSSSASIVFRVGVGLTGSTVEDNRLAIRVAQSPSASYSGLVIARSDVPITLSSATDYYLNYYVEVGGGAITMRYSAQASPLVITAQCPYV